MIQVNFTRVHRVEVPFDIRQKVTHWALLNNLAEAAGVVLNEGLRPIEGYWPKYDKDGNLVRDLNGKGELLYDVVPIVADLDPFPWEAIPYV